MELMGWSHRKLQADLERLNWETYTWEHAVLRIVFKYPISNMLPLKLSKSVRFNLAMAQNTALELEAAI